MGPTLMALQLKRKTPRKMRGMTIASDSRHHTANEITKASWSTMMTTQDKT